MELEGRDYVICRICGIRRRWLARHVNLAHHMSGKEYEEKTGGKIVCDAARAEVQASVNRFWAGCSLEKRKEFTKRAEEGIFKRYGVKNFFFSEEIQKELHRKSREAMLQKYGVENPFSMPRSEEKRKFVHQQHEKAIQKKYGVSNVMQVPEIKRKALKSLHDKTTPEKILESLVPGYIKYTGNGKFFIKFQTGELKNPDFVVRPFRKWKKVIEVFGDYWHKPEEETRYVKEYAKVGVSCLVVWERDLINNDSLEVKRKIEAFLQIPPPSETRRQTSA